MKHIIELRPKEEIVAIIRRHWIVLFSPVFLTLLLLIGSIALATFLISSSFIVSQTAPVALLSFIVGLCFLFAWGGIFTIFTNYYLNTWIITTERIVDVEQRAFFVRDITEFRFDRIQDVIIEVKGAIPTLLDFGNIIVQTAGEKSNFIIKTISEPARIQKIISEEIDKATTRHSRQTQP